jgi:hypothetical protein
MDLLCAIKAPRVHSQLMPPVVHVENHTLFSGKRVNLFYWVRLINQEILIFNAILVYFSLKYTRIALQVGDFCLT